MHGRGGGAQYKNHDYKKCNKKQALLTPENVLWATVGGSWPHPAQSWLVTITKSLKMSLEFSPYSSSPESMESPAFALSLLFSTYKE